jgi:hypothetical protein
MTLGTHAAGETQHWIPGLRVDDSSCFEVFWQARRLSARDMASYAAVTSALLPIAISLP